VIAQARERGRTGLTEIESRKIFAAYDLPVVDTRLARSEEEALDAAQDVGYPVVLKIVSQDILHKSDAGGVKVGIQNAQELSAAYQSLLKNAKQYKADAVIEGVAVQEMAAEGTEVIIGSVNDPTFGPTVMFGLGGIFVEVLEDTTFRVAPVSTSEAASMLGEIRAAAILEGARGKGPLDREALAETLSRYSEMAADLGDDIAETDANPCLVYEQGKGVKIVDARVILKEV
jgi:acetyltransferase